MGDLAAMNEAPVIAVSILEAARMLGMSRSGFYRDVRPHVDVIHQGGRVLIPVSEVERWASEHREHNHDRRRRDRRTWGEA